MNLKYDISTLFLVARKFFLPCEFGDREGTSVSQWATDNYLDCSLNYSSRYCLPERDKGVRFGCPTTCCIPGIRFSPSLRMLKSSSFQRTTPFERELATLRTPARRVFYTASKQRKNTNNKRANKNYLKKIAAREENRKKKPNLLTAHVRSRLTVRNEEGDRGMRCEIMKQKRKK